MFRLFRWRCVALECHTKHSAYAPFSLGGEMLRISDTTDIFDVENLENIVDTSYKFHIGLFLIHRAREITE